MSIYATGWEIAFPEDGINTDKVVWVTGQYVPGHIGTPTPGHGYEDGDPYGSFLPPPVEFNGESEFDNARAIVIIDDYTEKGLPGYNGQQYVNPLFTFSGAEYRSLSFGELMYMITEKLDDRYMARLAAKKTCWVCLKKIRGEPIMYDNGGMTHKKCIHGIRVVNLE